MDESAPLDSVIRPSGERGAFLTHAHEEGYREQVVGV
jgi:hypothetical protein